MNKLIPVLFLTMAIPAGQAFAEPGKADGRKDHKIERMVRDLGLSAEQQAKARAILEAEETKRRALREETRGAMQAVLTQAQFAKLEEGRGPHKHGEESRERKGCAAKRPMQQKGAASPT